MSDRDRRTETELGGGAATKPATSTLQRALVALEKAEKKLVAIERSKVEPIAIVGMACRLPGHANSVDAYWQLLRDQVDGISEAPRDRWTPDPSFPPETRWGGFIDGVDEFDPLFFGISPREVETMDPQQRLLLEVAWEALEDAGITEASLLKSDTGVFVGSAGSDYATMVMAGDWRSREGVHSTTGILGGAIAGRISYLLGLSGPAVVVDTACSSSLSALHLAFRSLRAGECEMALAAGVSLMLSPVGAYLLSKMAALSSDGRCKTFDAAADGYVRGEGCGVVVLKRLSDAERDGDRIWAVIRGTAMNQDGRSAGLAAPNMLAQQAVLRKALADARVSPAQIGYVETHGTGTSLGDPIEVEAIKEVLGQPRSDGSRCWLGAVKANIGHLEPASGIAGVIKVALVLDRGIIPGQLHFKALNPRIALADTSLAITQTTTPWPSGDKKRFAGLSGFGASGTNVHAILEQAPATNAPESPVEAAHYLLPISAKSPQALEALARSYAEYLQASTSKDIPLRDIAYTASIRRNHYSHRLTLTGASKVEIGQALEAFVRGELPSNIHQGQVLPDARPQVVFVFPGQGSQWVGMGRQLYREEPAFREALDACDQAIRKETGYSVVEELSKAQETSRLSEIDVVQPVLFAIEVALAALWRSWGIKPAGVVGHSMGEVAAAFVAGALSMEDAAAIICRRSRLLRKVAGKGAMALAELTLAEAEKSLVGYEDRLSVAVSNGPRSTVIAGDPAALEEVLGKLEKEQVFCRRVKVDVASHSPQMDPLRDELIGELSTIKPKTSNMTMFSTVTGTLVRGDDLSATYWANNLRKPVLFSQVITSYINDGHTIFIEMSPHPILMPSVEENLREVNADGVALASLRREQDERQTMLSSLGGLFVRGVAIDWNVFFPNKGQVLRLPTYPWQRRHFDRQTPTASTRETRTTDFNEAGHPLLGKRVLPLALPGTHIWQSVVGPQIQSFLADHCIQGEILFPGTGCAEMVIAAATEVYGPWSFTIRNVSFEQMCIFAPDEERIMQFVLVEKEDKTASFQIFGRRPDDTAWTLHYAGLIAYSPPKEQRILEETVADIQARCPDTMTAAEHYERMDRRDMCFGPSFQGVQQIWRGKGEALARVRLPEAAAKDAHAYHSHPGYVDACGQVLSSLLSDLDAFGRDTTFVGLEGGLSRFTAPIPPEAWVHIKPALASHNQEGVQGFHLTIFDDNRHVVGEIRDVYIHRIEKGKAAAHTITDSVVLAMQWRKTRPSAAKSTVAVIAGSSWLVFADESGLGQALVAKLKSAGHECVVVKHGNEFARLDNDEYRVDPHFPADFDRLFDEAFGTQRPCRGVLYLWGLDGAAWERTNLETIVEDQARGTMGAVYAVQALLRRGWIDTPPLWLLTRGVHQVDGEEAAPVAVSQAPLWGLGQTLQLEHSELRCVCMDLRLATESDEVDGVLLELGANDGENRVALRKNARHVWRFARSSFGAAPSVPVTLRPDATYLITGGLSGLGFAAAQWMVDNGARCLVLTGRRTPSEEVGKAIAAMSATGATIRVMQSDVSRRQDVEAVLATIDATLPPLRGILHVAGVLEDHSILALNAEHFQKVFAPKVLGTWHLHELTAGRPLDFLVLYSSGSAVFGAPGQANYSASNTFLDALARARHAIGLPAMSIQWGVFNEVGLAIAQENRLRNAVRFNAEYLSPKQGNAALARLLARPRTVVSIQQLNIAQISQNPTFAELPLLAELRKTVRAPVTPSQQSLQFREQLMNAAAEQKPNLLAEHIKQVVAHVLHLQAGQVDARTSFAEMGMDSLMNLELRNRLEASLKLRVPATTLFTHSNAQALTAHLLARLGLV